MGVIHVKTLNLRERGTIYRMKQIDLLKKQYQSIKEGREDLLRILDETEMPEVVYNSNAIENSTLTLPETQKILMGLELSRNISVREIFEAKNLATVLNYIKTAAIKQKIDSEMILLLHKMLIGSIDDTIAGRYRAEGEYVKVGMHIAPNPLHIEPMIKELILDYYSSDSQYIIDHIAQFHLRFEKIHPFIGGNGRTGRALIDYQLIEQGYPPIIIREQEKSTYFECFNEFEDSKTIKGLVRLMELSLIEAFNRRITHLKGLKIVNLVEYARHIGKSENSLLNKAKRQTIPAFREQGKWKIGLE
jgi:Fic family protein